MFFIGPLPSPTDLGKGNLPEAKSGLFSQMDLLAETDQGKEFGEVAGISRLTHHSAHEHRLILAVGVAFPVKPADRRGFDCNCLRPRDETPVVERRVTSAIGLFEGRDPPKHRPDENMKGEFCLEMVFIFQPERRDEGKFDPIRPSNDPGRARRRTAAGRRPGLDRDVSKTKA
jgi:hypothetical protein